MNKRVRLGITGLRRTGKTVFLTSLIYQLTEVGSHGLAAFEDKGVTLLPARVLASWDDQVEQFKYGTYLQAFRNGEWPDPTVSEAAYSLKCDYKYPTKDGRWDRIKGWAGRARSNGTLKIDLHDFPGEYLLDVPMLDTSFEDWSEATLERMRTQAFEEARTFEQAGITAAQEVGTEILPTLRQAYGNYALAARKANLEFIQPAVSLINWFPPEGQPCRAPDSSELPFVPLPQSLRSNAPLLTEMRSAYETYCREKVKPFVTRIRRCDVHLNMVDVLRVWRRGIDVYNDSRQCLAEVLRAYYPQNRLWGGIHRTLFAATKSDHVTSPYRKNLRMLLDELVWKAKGSIQTKVANASSVEFTSLRSTEDVKAPNGQWMLIPWNAKPGKAVAFGMNPLPKEWPKKESDWVGRDDDVVDFPPHPMPKLAGAPLPHINLDLVLWRLLEHVF